MPILTQQQRPPSCLEPRAGGKGGCVSRAHGERIRACILLAIVEMTPAAQERGRMGPTVRGVMKHLHRSGVVISLRAVHVQIMALVREGRLWKQYARHGGIQLKGMPRGASVE